jgi:hypothetical protein
MAANCDFTMDSFRSNLPIALSIVTPKTCQKLIDKVVKQEDKYWSEDSQLYDSVETEEFESELEETYEE